MRAARLTISLIFVATLLGSPSLASAAQSFAISSPTGFPAGGDPSYTTNIGLDSGAGTPSSLAINLMPGVLASPAANPSCVSGSPQHTPACEIGTGTVSLLGLPLSLPAVTAYLVPPPNSSDLVGIDLVVGVGPLSIATLHGAGKLVQTASGNIQVVLSVPLNSLPSLLSAPISGMSLTVNGTLNGKPFNRMPTNCSPGQSTLTVVYANKTETTAASPDFKPTGCSNLPYAPKFSATAHQDAHDSGTAVHTTVTQKIGQAATAKLTLTLPKATLAANLAAVPLQNTSTPVGTAVASSPLLPKPLRGEIFLVGTPLSARLKIRFPPPAVLQLTGVVSIGSDSVTIPAVPDVPLTSLAVAFPGGPRSLLAGDCLAPKGRVQASFVGQNGKSATDHQLLTLGGCPAHSG